MAGPSTGSPIRPDRSLERDHSDDRNQPGFGACPRAVRVYRDFLPASRPDYRAAQNRPTGRSDAKDCAVG
jgi:hypothetical protein